MRWAKVRFVLAFLAVSAGSAGAGDRKPVVSCPADQALADLVAASDLIVVGSMDVPGELIEQAKLQSPKYVDISVAVTRTIKGSSSERITVRVYPKDAPYKPSNDTLLRLSGSSSVLFLTQVDQDPVSLYFAGYNASALRPASEDEAAAISAEIARQNTILRTWHKNPSLPHYREVRNLLSRLGPQRGDAQEEVFRRLEALGRDAVPAIISQMDDRRPLGYQAMSLMNKGPGAFEAKRHYGPKLVVDALAAILNQITGASFGDIMNGGSDRERAATVAGWRVYANDFPCRRPPSRKG